MILGMYVGLEKCAMLIIKSRKGYIPEEFALTNQKKKNWRFEENETYKYLWIFEGFFFKSQENKKYNRKKNL